MRYVLGMWVLLVWSTSTLGMCAAAISGDERPLSITIEYNDDAERFAPKQGWSCQRLDSVAWDIQPDQINPTIYRHLFEEYKRVTGIKVEVRLETQLHEFLAERGIPPSELKFLDKGLQGSLMTHPKLGDWVLKIQNTTFNFGESQTAHAPETQVHIGDGRKKIADLQKAFIALEAIRARVDPSYSQIIDRQSNEIRIAFRAQGKQALHFAQKLMLPTIVASQAQTQYFDFARVSYIGNGFFLREYDPDADLSSELGESLIEADGRTWEDFESHVDSLKHNYATMHSMALHLIGHVPSFFTSRKFFEASPIERRRIFIIYDLD